MARLSFRCDEELIREVDAIRGQIPRERFLRGLVTNQIQTWPGTDPTRFNRVAVEQALGSSASRSDVPDSSLRESRVAAAVEPSPAEQPRRHGNVGPKRDVQPIPKRGK